MDMEWKTKTQSIGPSREVLHVGRWPVGDVYHDATRSRGEPPHAARTRLPGLTALLGHYESEGDARAKVERATEYWLAGLATMGEDE